MALIVVKNTVFHGSFGHFELCTSSSVAIEFPGPDRRRPEVDGLGILMASVVKAWR